MRICILPDETYQVVGNKSPKLGQVYFLEPAEGGTLAQNNAFHALVQEYFNSGCYPDNVNTWLELREHIKHRLGAGFELYIYWDPRTRKIKKAKNLEDIPSIISRRDMIHGVLKSWGKYTKKERMSCLNNLIAEMHTTKVQTAKFYEILDGMQSWI